MRGIDAQMGQYDFVEPRHPGATSLARSNSIGSMRRALKLRFRNPNEVCKLFAIAVGLVTATLAFADLPYAGKMDGADRRARLTFARLCDAAGCTMAATHCQKAIPLDSSGFTQILDRGDTHMTPRLAYTLAACCLAILPALAQAPGLANVNTQLRAQETKDSQLMWWLHEVTDVYGPRLTGSPGLRAAQDFAVGQMVKWGFSNVHLEAWNFNHPGWQNWDLEANAVSPFQQPLNVRAVSWTPGTNGQVQGAVLGGGTSPAPGRRRARRAGRRRWRRPGGRGGGLTPEELAAIENPGSAPPPMPAATPSENKPVTQAALDAYLASIKDKVRGAIIFYGPHVQVQENFVPAALRRTEDSWSQPGGRGGGRGGPAAAAAGGARGARGARGAAAAAGDAAPEGLTAAEIAQQVNKFLIENGALVKVTDAGRAYGVIAQQSTAVTTRTRRTPTCPRC